MPRQGQLQVAGARWGFRVEQPALRGCARGSPAVAVAWAVGWRASEDHNSQAPARHLTGPRDSRGQGAVAAAIPVESRIESRVESRAASGLTRPGRPSSVLTMPVSLRCAAEGTKVGGLGGTPEILAALDPGVERGKCVSAAVIAGVGLGSAAGRASCGSGSLSLSAR